MEEQPTEDMNLVTYDSPPLNCTDINIPVPEGGVDLEIVGLLGKSNGRSCNQHECCGATLLNDQLLRLVKCCVMVRGKEEEAIKFVRVTAEGDGCTIGFLPRVWINLPKVVDNINNFCIVTEIYNDSENRCKRLTSHRIMGMAGVLLLSSIPMNE